ncbi:hypothetical protein C6P08_04980 [Weissella confusa]|uniref:AAA family ATPase n=2 Tax=Weissella confusa TaxID=1583 RepID=UPI001092B447|nr:AAA family ATPase [Weissella confusa]MBJ7695539.1 AAA family ATPase [Weissella confusa]QBZ04571.1 hypothetical protein C6P08_04980 [Weissella confusa]
MKIYITGRTPNINAEKFIRLFSDNWDDYGYKTTFNFSVVNLKKGEEIPLGRMNIAAIREGQSDIVERTKDVFSNINFMSVEDWSHLNPDITLISVGGLEYYEGLLTNLTEDERKHLFETLGDIAFSEPLYEQYRGYPGVQNSFFRGLSYEMVENRLRRIAQGGEIRENFDFEFIFKTHSNHIITLNLTNDTEAILPSNMYVFTGANGAGKTRLIKDITNSLSVDSVEVDSQLVNGTVSAKNQNKDFKHIVVVSTSPFDNLEDLDGGVVDLIEITKDTTVVDKKLHDNLDKLAGQEFWSEISGLFLFEADIAKLFKPRNPFEDNDNLEVIRGMSTGQKVIFLTLSELLLHDGEMTFYVIDEPEVYLHPPYVAAFAQAISLIATRNNSMAMVVTHSPFFVQMVPENKVFIVRRSLIFNEKLPVFESPSITTFGRNVEAINREIFGVEVLNTGYYEFLRKLVKQSPEKAAKLLDKKALSPEATLYLKDLLR